MALGTNLKDLLNERGITVKDFAKKIGVPPTTLYSFIQRDSQDVKLELIAKIADGLNIPITELLTYKDDTINGERVKVYDLTGMEPYQVVDTIKHIQNNVTTTTGVSPEYITLHLSKDEFSEEEIHDIERYIEFVKSKKKPFWSEMGKTIKDINQPDD
nr:MAG TPA: Cro/C1-type HTH DNA-binding domain protein [Caudoviricetes sp.]